MNNPEVLVRGYVDEDYQAVKGLYAHKEWYGGNFDEARDARQMLRAEVEHDPQAILVAESELAIVGTASLILTPRMAMLYRFAVRDNDPGVTDDLYQATVGIVKDRGYTRLDVYTSATNAVLCNRYEALGMERGGTFRFYWTSLESGQ